MSSLCVSIKKAESLICAILHLASDHIISGQKFPVIFPMQKNTRLLSRSTAQAYMSAARSVSVKPRQSPVSDQQGVQWFIWDKDGIHVCSDRGHMGGHLQDARASSMRGDSGNEGDRYATSASNMKRKLSSAQAQEDRDM